MIVDWCVFVILCDDNNVSFRRKLDSVMKCKVMTKLCTKCFPRKASDFLLNKLSTHYKLEFFSQMKVPVLLRVFVISYFSKQLTFSKLCIIY